MRARRRRLAIGGLVLAFVLGVLVTRVYVDGRAALAQGDAALARGDVEEAIVGWRRAARWYAPGAPHVSAAYARLEELAGAAEAREDDATALAAWRAIRSSILATRSFYVPFPARLDAANARIAALMAREERPAAGRDETERRAFHLALLQRDEAPKVGWTLLALLGFAAWVGGGFWFALRGVTAEDRLDRRVAARAGLLVAIGLLVWMLGLVSA